MNRGDVRPGERRIHIGPHVSIRGGVQEAPIRARELGATAMGMFTRNQRRWSSKPLTDGEIGEFRANLVSSGIAPEHVVVHASYLVNPANPDPDKRRRSVDALIEECRRVEALGLSLVNFHPGSGLGEVTEKRALELIGEGLRIILGETERARPVLECTAGQGAHAGYRFDHLARIIEAAGEDARIGVCLDTCHAFAAGYDFSTPEGYRAMMGELDATAGLARLVAVHLNDSLTESGSRRDRHAGIGEGLIGSDGLRNVAADPALAELPFVLETPNPDRWKEEMAEIRSWAGE